MIRQVNYDGLKKREPLTAASHQNVRKYVDHQKTIKDILDSYSTRAANVQFRKKVLDNQIYTEKINIYNFLTMPFV